jgi:aryl-alcohol dehydrogenase-like predicted oxidoreductase
MGGDPRRHIEEADVADLAGGDQVVERSQRLLDRGAWVRSRPAVTSTLIGARTIEQLRANLTS